MMLTRSLKAQECSLTLLDSPVMLCQQPLIILLTVYSSSKGFPVNLLRSEKNMFPSFPSRNCFLELRIVFNQQRKKTGKVHIFFNLKQYKLLHGGGGTMQTQFFLIETIQKYLGNAYTLVQETITKTHFYISLDIILVERKSFGNTELSSNSIKIKSINCLSGLWRTLLKTKPIHEPLFRA